MRRDEVIVRERKGRSGRKDFVVKRQRVGCGDRFSILAAIRRGLDKRPAGTRFLSLNSVERCRGTATGYRRKQSPARGPPPRERGGRESRFRFTGALWRPGGWMADATSTVWTVQDVPKHALTCLHVQRRPHAPQGSSDRARYRRAPSSRQYGAAPGQAELRRFIRRRRRGRKGRIVSLCL